MDYSKMTDGEWVNMYFFVNDQADIEDFEKVLVPAVEGLDNTKINDWFSVQYSEQGISKKKGEEHLLTDHHFKLVLWRKPEWKDDEVRKFFDAQLTPALKAKLCVPSTGKENPWYDFKLGTPKVTDGIAQSYLACLGNKVKRLMEKRYGQILSPEALLFAMHFAIQKQGYRYEAFFGANHLLNGVENSKHKLNQNDVVILHAVLNNILPKL